MHQLALLYITFLIKKLRVRSRGPPTAGEAPCHGTNGTMGNPALDRVVPNLPYAMPNQRSDVRTR